MTKFIQKLLEDLNDWHAPLPDKIQMDKEHYKKFYKEAQKSYGGLFLYDYSTGKRGEIIRFCRVPIEITEEAMLGYCHVHLPKEKNND